MLVWRGGRLIWCRGPGHVTSATWALAGVAVLLGGLGGLACRRPAPAVPPPPEVSVLTVAPETVSAHYEFVGEAAASRRVEVRSQVTGVILARRTPRARTSRRERCCSGSIRLHMRPPTAAPRRGSPTPIATWRVSTRCSRRAPQHR